MIDPGQVGCVIPYAGAHAYPGARKHLFEALDSALSQGFGELIVSYDGPEPQPLAGLPQAERVRIVRLPSRVGPAQARNAGIKACTKPYIVLLDQDDVLCSGYLPSMLSWVEQHQIRCAAATLHYIGESQKRVGSIVSRHPDFFLPSGFFAEVALIAEVGYFPDSLSEDLFFFQAIRKIVPISTCPTAQVLYRIHPNASSGNMITAWALIKLVPQYKDGTYTLAEINSLARAYATEGKIPAGMEEHFRETSFPVARFLARNAYASWLNRDFIGMVKYSGKLVFHLPKLSRMARYKWGRKRLA